VLYSDLFFHRFIGAATRRRTLLNIYWMVLSAHLLFSIASGIFSIYSMFNEGVTSQLTEQCADAAVDDITNQFCGNGMTVVKGIIIAFFVISWLFQLCPYLLIFSICNPLNHISSRWMHYHRQLRRPIRRREGPISAHEDRVPRQYCYTCHNLQLVWGC
jgi:hypothetical protein